MNCIFETIEGVSEKINSLIGCKNTENLHKTIEENYVNSLKICSFRNYKERLKRIYEKIES